MYKTLPEQGGILNQDTYTMDMLGVVSEIVNRHQTNAIKNMSAKVKGK
jgi:hypothetical protein